MMGRKMSFSKAGTDWALLGGRAKMNAVSISSQRFLAKGTGGSELIIATE